MIDQSTQNNEENLFNIQDSEIYNDDAFRFKQSVDKYQLNLHSNASLNNSRRQSASSNRRVLISRQKGMVTSSIPIEDKVIHDQVSVSHNCKSLIIKYTYSYYCQGKSIKENQK